MADVPSRQKIWEAAGGGRSTGVVTVSRCRPDRSRGVRSSPAAAPDGDRAARPFRRSPGVGSRPGAHAALLRGAGRQFSAAAGPGAARQAGPGRRTRGREWLGCGCRRARRSARGRLRGGNGPGHRRRAAAARPGRARDPGGLAAGARGQPPGEPADLRGAGVLRPGPAGADQCGESDADRRPGPDSAGRGRARGARRYHRGATPGPGSAAGAAAVRSAALRHLEALRAVRVRLLGVSERRTPRAGLLANRPDAPGGGQGDPRVRPGSGPRCPLGVAVQPAARRPARPRGTTAAPRPGRQRRLGAAHGERVVARAGPG